MNSIQESTNELNAAIRYAENAIASAKQTIESMQFRQDMAMKQYTEQTGREQALEAKVAQLKAEVDKLKAEKEASSGPCGCQAYRDLEERADSLVATTQRLKRDEPTMPVIPKAVAIAIFREGVQHGVANACDELDNSDSIEISETGYTGDFEVSFSKYVDLTEHIDLDWMRDKVGDYDEASVIEALKNLCADKEFECRIHGIDDNPTNND